MFCKAVHNQVRTAGKPQPVVSWFTQLTNRVLHNKRSGFLNYELRPDVNLSVLRPS